MLLSAIAVTSDDSHFIKFSTLTMRVEYVDDVGCRGRTLVSLAVIPRQDNVRHTLAVIPRQDNVRHTLAVIPRQDNVRHTLAVIPRQDNVRHTLAVIPRQDNVRHTLAVIPRQDNVRHTLAVIPRQDNVRHTLAVIPRQDNVRHTCQHYHFLAGNPDFRVPSCFFLRKFRIDRAMHYICIILCVCLFGI